MPKTCSETFSETSSESSSKLSQLGSRQESGSLPAKKQFRMIRLPSEHAFKLSVLIIILIVTAIFAMGVGAVNVSMLETIAIIAASAGFDLPWQYTEMQEIVLTNIRAPRVLLGMLVGASLAISGSVMQGLFRNPLADPALIGVSSGAALAAVCVIVLGNVIFGELSGLSLIFTLPVAAFFGGVLTSLLVYRFATINGATDVATMLLAGIAITAIAGAGLGVLTFLADDAQLRTLTFWTMGSLGGVTWLQLLVATPFLILPVFLMPRYASFLNTMLLGEAEAGHLGFEIQHLKFILILLVAMTVGAAVSLTGVIGFVGLMVPHLIRLAVGPDHRFLLPASAILGAIILLFADLLARTLVAPAELPIGIITAILGGPFFLWLLNKRRSRVQF